MSRGPGRWQRLLLDQLTENAAFPLRDMCKYLDPPRAAWSPSELSALNRAAHDLETAGRCQLVEADALSVGLKRANPTPQAVVFIARPDVQIQVERRPRSTSRFWVTVTYTDPQALGAFPWPGKGPGGERWHRVRSGRQAVTGGGDEDKPRRQKRTRVVRIESRDFLEFTVGMGMADSRMVPVLARLERREEVRGRGVVPYVGGQFEHWLPPRLAGLRTRALALAITLLGHRMGGFFPTSGPTVQHLEDIAGGTLRDSLRELARSGHLFVDDRDRLFVVGGFLRGADPQWVNGRRAEVRLELMFGHPEAETGAEMVAELTTSVSVEGLRIGEGA